MRPSRLLVALLALLLAGPLGPPAARSALPAAPATESLAHRARLGGGGARAVATGGGLLATGIGPSLALFDLADPANPALRSQLPVGATIAHLAIVADTLYALLLAGPGQQADLAAFDIADPVAPRLLGRVALGLATDLAAGDGLAFVASGASVRVFGAAGAGRLDQVATIDLADAVSFSPEPLAFVGRRLYVGTSAGLAIFDLADPAAPRLLGQRPIPGAELGLSVALVAGYAYLTTATGLLIADVRDPTSPALVGSAPGAYDLHTLGRYAVGLGGAGLAVFDVRDPARPVLELSRRIGDSAGFFPAMDVLSGYAYVAFDSEIAVVRLTDPLAPAVAGALDARPYGGGVARSGDYLYMSDHVLSIADPDRPRVVGTYDGPITVVAGGYGYGVDGALRIYSLADPARPGLIGSYERGISITGLALRGDIAYLADAGSCGRGGCSGGGLHVVDLADRARPAQVAFLLGLNVGRPLVFGAYLYGVGADALRVFSLADPALPREVGAVPLPGASWSATPVLAGGRLYLLRLEELLVYDLADPTAPQLVGRAPVGGLDLAVAEPYAYVLTTGGILQVVDVAAPERPRARGGVQVAVGGYPASGSSLAAQGDRLYAGLYGLDVYQRVPVELPNAAYLPLLAR